MRYYMFAAGLLFAACAPRASAEMGSKYKMDMYGFVKTDFIYSDHGTLTNEYRAYTSSGRKDRTFRVSSSATRFGFDISASSSVAGKIEADFLGLTDSLSGTAGTVSDLRLRLAYATVTVGKTEFLAGQTYYPITADIPETLNDYYLGNSGALWSRAPQLRATYKPAEKLKIIAAVTRPTGKLTDAEGTHSALPGFQGKIEKQLGKARISLAGAAGVWKSTSSKTADISAVVAAFNVPFSIFTVYGEAWKGRNLTDFLGGLGNLDYGAKAVPSEGGYLALKVKPENDLWFTAAYGVDDPDNSRVTTLNAKTKNTTVFANAVVRLYDCLETGVEAAELVTQYRGAANLYERSSMNYQLTVKFIF